MSDTEKVSFNMSVVDLGQVDLLVGQGFYSSRTDFIRTAARNLLLTHAPTVQEAVARQLMALGMIVYDRRTLERELSLKRQLDIRVVGVLVLAQDVTAKLARAAIRSIKVYGVFRASNELKAALADRTE